MKSRDEKSRDEYLTQIRTALGKLEVKASLARLELHDVRDDLRTRYDGLRDKLREVGTASEEKWGTMRSDVESTWTSFKGRFENAMEKHRDKTT